MKCKFCGAKAPNNMQGYCQACYRYFVIEGKDIYVLPGYSKVEYNDRGECICHECGKAFRKLGGHIRMAHHMDAAEFYRIHGLNPRKCKCSCEDYRKHMHDIQDKKTIDKNLIVKGKGTRLNEDSPLSFFIVRRRCKDCMYNDGEYYCKARSFARCDLIKRCKNKKVK